MGEKGLGDLSIIRLATSLINIISMHELSIVLGIVEIAENQVKQHQSRRVEAIELEIGYLAGVEWEALEFAWEAATKHTVLENSQREVARIEGAAKCLECQRAFPISSLFEPCPSCGSYFSEVTRGKELRIKSLTIV